MKKKSLLLVLFTICSSFAFGQNATDSITLVKEFGGYQCYQGGKRLNMSKLVNTMKPNEQAYKKIEEARSMKIISGMLGFVGGGMIGWTLGTKSGGGDPNWALAGVGAAIIVLSIPISNECTKQLKGAVEIYNKGLNASSLRHKKELKLIMTGGKEIGLKLVF